MQQSNHFVFLMFQTHWKTISGHHIVCITLLAVNATPSAKTLSVPGAPANLLKPSLPQTHNTSFDHAPLFKLSLQPCPIFSLSMNLCFFHNASSHTHQISFFVLVVTHFSASILFQTFLRRHWCRPIGKVLQLRRQCPFSFFSLYCSSTNRQLAFKGRSHARGRPYGILVIKAPSAQRSLQSAECTSF